MIYLLYIPGDILMYIYIALKIFVCQVSPEKNAKNAIPSPSLRPRRRLGVDQVHRAWRNGRVWSSAKRRMCRWIGLREKLQEKPIFTGIDGLTLI